MPTGWLDVRAVRFVLTGGVTAVLFFLLSFALVTGGVEAFWGNLIAYAAAFVVGYATQRGWTFKARHRHGQALPRYVMLQVGSALASGIAAHICISHFGLSPLATSCATTVLASGLSYVGSSLWVFPDTTSLQSDAYAASD